MSSFNAGETYMPVPWARLTAWVLEQESLERETGRSHLSETQLNAISQLVPFIVEEDPDLGSQNYVSKLMEYSQARAVTLPTFSDLEPVYAPVGGAMVLRWRCECVLSPSGGVFPREGYGYERGSNAPTFPTKKIAKQFAAKHALAFVGSRNQGTSGSASSRNDRDSPLTSPSPSLLMLPPQKLPAVASTASPVTPPKSPKSSQLEQIPTARNGTFTPLAKSPSRVELISRSSTPSSQITLSSGDESPGPAPSVIERIDKLATKLHFGKPRYVIEPDGDSPLLFNARVIFKNQTRFPVDETEVKGVLGKAQAKMEVVEKVLARLEKETQTKERSFQALFSS